MFVKSYVMVNILEKPEPLIIKVQGVPRDAKIFNVFLSTREQFPNDQNNTIWYKNQRRMEFFIRGNPKPTNNERKGHKHCEGEHNKPD